MVVNIDCTCQFKFLSTIIPKNVLLLTAVDVDDSLFSVVSALIVVVKLI